MYLVKFEEYVKIWNCACCSFKLVCRYLIMMRALLWMTWWSVI